ncbi:MAG: hypothetical protein ACOC1X_03695 [Promethearchaeota archaeon]
MAFKGFITDPRGLPTGKEVDFNGRITKPGVGPIGDSGHYVDSAGNIKNAFGIPTGNYIDSNGYEINEFGIPTGYSIK